MKTQAKMPDLLRAFIFNQSACFEDILSGVQS